MASTKIAFYNYHLLIISPGIHVYVYYMVFAKLLQENYLKIFFRTFPYVGADPGFQVRGGALKKNAPSGGRREICLGISCEKSRFYAKNFFFSNFRGVRPPPGSAPAYGNISG